MSWAKKRATEEQQIEESVTIVVNIDGIEK